MALFSQREGIHPLSKAIQRESIDADLRNALWSAFYDTFRNAYYVDEGEYGFPYYPFQDELNEWLYSLWTKFYKRTSDTKPKFRDTIDQIRADFFAANWHWVLDFLEFSVK